MVKTLLSVLGFATIVSACESTTEAPQEDAISATDTVTADPDTVAPDGVGPSSDTVETPADTTTLTDTAAPMDILAPADTTAPVDTIEPTDTTTAPSDTTPPSDAIVSPVDCSTICQARTGDGGFCLDDGYFGVAACTQYCQQDSALWDATARDAFADCAATDPLCFQTIHQCMMSAIYADEIESDTPIAMTIRVHGGDFSAHNGAWVFAEFQQGFFGPLALDTAVVADGSFDLNVDFNEVPHYNAVYYLRAYANVDGQLGCGVSTDLGFGGDVAPRFGTTPLLFERTLKVDEPVASSQMQEICDAF